MCYLIAKRINQSGCIALQTKPGLEMAKLADDVQEKLGYDIKSLQSVDQQPIMNMDLIILSTVTVNLLKKPAYFNI